MLNYSKELLQVLETKCKMLKPACPLPEAWYIAEPSAIVWIHCDQDDPILFEIEQSGVAGSIILDEQEFLNFPKKDFPFDKL